MKHKSESRGSPRLSVGPVRLGGTVVRMEMPVQLFPHSSGDSLVAAYSHSTVAGGLPVTS